MSILLEINVTSLNSKDWFDYLVLSLSAIGSGAAAIALGYVHKQFGMASVQQFENKFFQMLGLHNQIITDIKKEEEELFAIAKSRINDLFISHDDDGYGGSEPEEVPVNSYKDVQKVLTEKYFPLYYREFEDKFNHYFRNLYHIFKFIYQSKILSEDEKRSYAAIARAQLSQNELFVIFFNSMILGYGNPKFLYLIKKFSLLKNFRFADVQQRIVVEYFNTMLNSVKKPRNW